MPFEAALTVAQHLREHRYAGRVADDHEDVGVLVGLADDLEQTLGRPLVDAPVKVDLGLRTATGPHPLCRLLGPVGGGGDDLVDPDALLDEPATGGRGVEVAARGQLTFVVVSVTEGLRLAVTKENDRAVLGGAGHVSIMHLMNPLRHRGTPHPGRLVRPGEDDPTRHVPRKATTHMSALDEILGALPMDQLAAQVGAPEADVAQAAAAVLPALLGGLDANAQDPGGATSILDALGQHQGGLIDGGVDLGQVDLSDGQAIAGHIFGANEDAVVNQLGAMPVAGGSGVGGQLVRKLIPILAPIVLSWLANQVLGKVQGGGTTGRGTQSQSEPTSTLPTSTTETAGTSGGAAPGSLDDLLKDVLGSAAGGASTDSTSSTSGQGGQSGSGSILTDILGGLLGGGRR